MHKLFVLDRNTWNLNVCKEMILINDYLKPYNYI